MKLSKAQAAVMEKAKKDIDEARNLDYSEWLRETESYFQVPFWADEETTKLVNQRWQKAVNDKYLYEYWEAKRNAVVLTHCNTKTLQKLEKLGLIEILEDSTGECYGIDTVKVLNY